MDNYLVLTIIVFFLILLWVNVRQLSNLRDENKNFIKKLKKAHERNDKLRLKTQAMIAKQPTIKVIKPPKPIKPKNKRVVRKIEINSGDRNRDLYPTPAEFEFRFTTPLKNIESIELAQFSMSKSMYTIDDHNSTMIVRDLTAGQKFTIVVEQGFYSIGTYLAELNRQFAEIYNMDIRATFNDVSSRVTITNMGVDTRYKIIYQTEEFEITNFNEIGFYAEDFELGPGESKEGERRVDLFGPTLMELRFREVSYGYGDDLLEVIQIKEDIITNYRNDNLRDRRIIQPLLNLDRLTVFATFTPQYKTTRPYEFNGIEYSMTLEVITLERELPFEQIITKYN